MTASKSLHICLAIALLSFHQISSADEKKIVTAKDVNGTWEASSTENIKGRRYGLFQKWSIRALGHQKLQVAFDGIYSWPGSDKDTPMANEGNVDGIATIEGNVAILKFEEYGPNCRFELTFHTNYLEVVGEDSCPPLFGGSVFADGKYKKTSNKPPALISTDNVSP